MDTKSDKEKRRGRLEGDGGEAGSERTQDCGQSATAGGGNGEGVNGREIFPRQLLESVVVNTAVRSHRNSALMCPAAHLMLMSLIFFNTM